jgi:predicted transposase/invertase (TIGR01784 family)
MYTKPPHKIAFENLLIYNIELPKFRVMEHDLANPLEAWLYILDTANQQQISVEEVISMNETLRNTVNIDPGLTQFINNYDVVSADDELRKEYNSYAQGLLYFTGVRRMAYESGIEEGKAVGIEQGIEQGKLATAYRLLKMGLLPEQIAEGADLPIETINKLSTENRPE